MRPLMFFFVAEIENCLLSSVNICSSVAKIQCSVKISSINEISVVFALAQVGLLSTRCEGDDRKLISYDSNNIEALIFTRPSHTLKSLTIRGIVNNYVKITMKQIYYCAYIATLCYKRAIILVSYYGTICWSNFAFTCVMITHRNHTY